MIMPFLAPTTAGLSPRAGGAVIVSPALQSGEDACFRSQSRRDEGCPPHKPAKHAADGSPRRKPGGREHRIFYEPASAGDRLHQPARSLPAICRLFRCFRAQFSYAQPEPSTSRMSGMSRSTLSDIRPVYTYTPPPSPPPTHTPLKLIKEKHTTYTPVGY